MVKEDEVEDCDEVKLDAVAAVFLFRGNVASLSAAYPSISMLTVPLDSVFFFILGEAGLTLVMFGAASGDVMGEATAAAGGATFVGAFVKAATPGILGGIGGGAPPELNIFATFFTPFRGWGALSVPFIVGCCNITGFDVSGGKDEALKRGPGVGPGP